MAEANVIEDGWTATFRVPDWDDSKSYQYRAAHGTKAFFGGTIRKNPIDKDEICAQWKQLYLDHDVEKRIGIELTGLGAGQTSEWVSDFFQGRVRKGRFFGQAYYLTNYYPSFGILDSNLIELNRAFSGGGVLTGVTEAVVTNNTISDPIVQISTARNGNSRFQASVPRSRRNSRLRARNRA